MRYREMRKNLEKPSKYRVKAQAIIREQQKVRIEESNSAIKQLVRELVA
jgi:hypothetical protein